MKALLKNGNIVDGSGAPSYRGSVIIEGSKIAGIIKGTVPGGFSGEVVDCSDLTIAPGFIDAHSHNDWFAARQNPIPHFKPFAEQGIATQVVGNCGFSPFGYEADTAHRKLIGGGLFHVGDAQGDFSSYEGWRKVAEKKTPLNLVPLQGYGAIRTGLCGYENRPLSKDELTRRDAVLEESLEQGLFGASFGLMYEPDRYATAEELEGAAQIVAKHNGILTVHPRACSAVSTSYSPPFGGRPHNLRALDEMIALARRTGVKLQYSHLIFVGESSWKTVEESLELIDKIRADGFDFAYDLYPMTFGVSVITVVLPSWYLSLPPEKRTRTWTKLRLAAEIGLSKRLLGFGFEDIIVAWIGEGYEELSGKSIAEIAAEWKLSEIEAYIRLVELSRAQGRVNMYKYYNEEAITRLIRHRPSIFMTDAWIEEKGLQNAGAYGAFPKFLALSREGRGLPLEETVRKMTGATADRFSLKGRGYLKKGYTADITVFNADTIANSGDEPLPPKGIVYLYVNGKRIVSGGRADEAAMTGSGAILRRV